MRRFSTGPVAPLRALNTIETFLNSSTHTTESLRSALVACTTLEAAYKASSRPDYQELPREYDVQEAQSLLGKVLNVYKTQSTTNKDLRVTNQTLLEYFSSSHPPSTESGLQVLKAFTQQNPNNVVPELIAMIPFRRAGYEANFKGALSVMRATCGEESNYKTYMNKKLAKIGGMWSVGIGSALTGVHQALASGHFGAWDSGTSLMICVMFGTYLTALSVYGAMAISGSKSGMGPVLEWVPGTSPLYRFRHAVQLKMAMFATELNRSLPENLGECSPQLLEDLKEINLKPVETKEEANLKEYWARAGAGFEWAEPDQDPADLLWAQHMDATRQQRITSAYSRKDSEGKLLSWMTEVEKEKQGMSIPHASLLEIEDINTDEGMKLFEKELENDMKQLRKNDAKRIEGDTEGAGKKDGKEPPQS